MTRKTTTPSERRALDLRRWRIFAAARFRSGWRRVEGSFVPIVQSAIGAAVAWFVAANLMGRDVPIFAPIATWVCLGFKADRVPRKVAELGAGATLGVLLGELFAHFFAIGPLQVFVVLVVSALAGRFLDRGDLFTMQAGVNSIVILGMASWQVVSGGVHGRWQDALVGAGVAFVIAVLLPRHPTSRPRRYAANTLADFATLLEMLGRGLQAGDPEKLADVRGQRRVLTQTTAGWEEAMSTAREVVALNPSLRRYRGEVAELGRLARLTRRAQRSTDMLARQALAMTEEVGRLPVVGGLVEDTARAAHALAGSVQHWNQPERAREILLEVAGRAGPGDIPGNDWRPLALAAVLRAVIVDLLQITGLSRNQAREALADTWGRPFADRDEGRPDATGRGGGVERDDGPSPLWG